MSEQACEPEVRTDNSDKETAAEVDVEQRVDDQFFEVRQRRAEMLRGTMESRGFPVEQLECRQLDDGTLRMGGYASVTERFYDIGNPENGGFRERISRSAFKRTLSENPDVVLLANHEGLPLARTKNGSLALREDASGLRWDADLDKQDPDSARIARKVDSGLIDQCSFAFVCTDDQWNDAFTERTIKSLSLHRGDVSVVTHAANDATSVTSIRSTDGLLELRAGKTISAANQEQLTRVLDLISSADDAVDEAQPLLATVLGVDNPDADDDESGEGSGDGDMAGRSAETPKPIVVPDHTTRARQRLALLRRDC